ncbi:MAG: hypothetical protein PHQ47_03065 [Candidatus Portnoybacteria bacterium]|nr:hypothetical protein [Candidatus Portnoybacteria bacterium]
MEAKGVREGLEEILGYIDAQASLAKIIRILTFMDDGSWVSLKPIFEALPKLVETLAREQGNDEEGKTECNYSTARLADLMDLRSKGQISDHFLEKLIIERQSVWPYTQYIAEPFRNSPQTFGALMLIAKYFRFRLKNDLGAEAVNWSKRLGEPKFTESSNKLLDSYPFLMPVVFSGGVKLSKPEFYWQFFGGVPALTQNAIKSKLFKAAFEKWPLADNFAFCPLATREADNEGKELWLEGRTWTEQLRELDHLRCKFFPMTVRFATLPELMWLDLSMHEANGRSPMGIWSFRCENPEDPQGCITYGGVCEYGAEIKESKPDSDCERVMPLFIPNEINVKK